MQGTLAAAVCLCASPPMPMASGRATAVSLLRYGREVWRATRVE